MALDLRVTLTPEQAADVVHHAIVDGSITGELIDYYAVSGAPGQNCIVAVYEKHYYRAGNRLTLTVIFDNLQGQTRVHTISGGGGEGFFRFDWGASESFESCAADALAPYIL